MLTLVALSRPDGWAVVRDGNHLLLVRPPYSRRGQRQVDDRFVETALSRLGFERPREPMEFSGWQPLIAHLHGEVANSRAEPGQLVDDAGLSEELLRLAPMSVLRGFLDRTRTELLPDPASWAGAERLLLTLLRLPQMIGSPDLHGATLDLLGSLLDAKGRRERTLAQAAVDMERFPRIAQRLGASQVNAFRDAVASRPTLMGV